jgi:hypothetical protein
MFLRQLDCRAGGAGQRAAAGLERDGGARTGRAPGGGQVFCGGEGGCAGATGGSARKFLAGGLICSRSLRGWDVARGRGGLREARVVSSKVSAQSHVCFMFAAWSRPVVWWCSSIIWLGSTDCSRVPSPSQPAGSLSSAPARGRRGPRAGYWSGHAPECNRSSLQLLMPCARPSGDLFAGACPLP